MLQCYWLHPEGYVLDREEKIGPVLDLVDAFPFGEWARYDLNGQDDWRPYTKQKASIDALTQRTQHLTFQGEGAQAMLSLGKFGEQPAAVFHWSGEGWGSREELEAYLRDILSALDIDRLSFVDREALREALGEETVPVVDRPGSWDWLGPRLAAECSSRDWQAAPGTAERVGGGVLLKAAGDLWGAASASYLRAVASWWGRGAEE